MINRIIIPTKDSEGNLLPDNKIDSYLRVIAEKFGGCTLFNGRGAYVTNTGLLILEDTIIIECDTPESTVEFWRILAQTIKTELSQESVYYREGEAFPEFI